MREATSPHAQGHWASPDRSHPLSQRVFVSFMRALHAHRQLMTRRLAQQGMHPGQAICLREIAHNDGMTQRDLAERLGVTRPTVTVMLQKMEKAELVERRRDPDDQRYTRLYLTEDGHAMHERMHDLMGDIVAEVVEPMSEDDQRELERLLGVLTEGMLAAADSVASAVGEQVAASSTESEAGL